MGQHVQKIFYMYATIDHRDHILGLLFIQERKKIWEIACLSSIRSFRFLEKALIQIL